MYTIKNILTRVFLIIESSLGGFGVFSKDAKINKNVVLGKINKQAIISRKTTAVCDIIEENELEGTLALTLALMFELLRINDSPWKHYLMSLPLYEPLPFTWSATEQLELRGTGLGSNLENYKKYLWADFETLYDIIVKNPLAFTSSDKEIYSELFFRSHTLIRSRAFHVDDFHQDAMVPFADLFNHNSNGEHIHMENDDDICLRCGDIFCNCDDPPVPEEVELRQSIVSELYGEPLLSTYNSKKNLKKYKEEEKHVFDDLFSENETTDVDNEEQYLHIVTQKVVEKDSEIFNTFGKLPNNLLLTRYGFLQDDNPFNCVSFSVKEFADFVFKEKELGVFDIDLFHNRIKLWRRFRRVIHNIEASLEDPEEEDWVDEETLDDELDNSAEEFISCEEDSDEEDSGDDTDEEVNEMINPSDLTINGKGFIDCDLLTIVAFCFAPKKFLRIVQNDSEVGKKWISEMLLNRKLNEQHGIFSFGNWLVASTAEDDSKVNNEMSFIYSTISPWSQKFKIFFKLFAEFKLSFLNHICEAEDLKKLNELVRIQK
ncbi:hypothetical protein HDU92_000747 [Lobulomyces angularis]|nr:hypothetical protein HDU92_000747 [Lobulomyces angularis]